MVFLVAVGCLVVGFVAGILVGRKNKQSVEKVVGAVKDKTNLS